MTPRVQDKNPFAALARCCGRRISGRVEGDQPFPVGAGAHDTNANFDVLNDGLWWQPMTDEEIDALFGLYGIGAARIETGPGLTRMLS